MRLTWIPFTRGDIVVPETVASWFGGDHDPDDNGETASGILWVQTIDLVGGSVDYVKQTVSVTSRPTSSSTQEQARAWLVRHNSSLDDLDFSAATLAAGKLNLDSLVTVVDPNSPALLAPFDMPTNGAGFNYELLDGAVTPWMYDTDGLLCADATLKFSFSYTGADDKTQKYMKSLGGVLIIPVKCKITNAGGVSGFTSATVTKVYQTTASAQAAEPVPDGYAQYLYETLAPLHFQGDLTLVEVECSDRVPPGSVFNTSDGRTEWLTMQALVMSVEEEVDTGTTKVKFGPPLMLGLDTKAELYRANLGRLPSSKLQQRGTGKATDGGNVVQGHSQSSASSSSLPPPGVPGPLPWQPTLKNVGTSGSPHWQASVGLGVIMKSQTRSDTLDISGFDTPVDIDPTGDFFYVEVPVASYVAGTGNILNKASGSFDPAKPAWDAGGKGYLANDGSTPPSQTFFRVLLATIATPSGTTAPVVTPCCSSNLLMFSDFILGEPCIIAYPSPTATA